MPDLSMLPSPPNGPFTADYEVEGFVARTLRGGEYRTSPTDRVRMTLRYGILLHGNAGHFMRQMEELRDQDILIPDWTQERSVQEISTSRSVSWRGHPRLNVFLLDGQIHAVLRLEQSIGRIWKSSESTDGYLLRWGDGNAGEYFKAEVTNDDVAAPTSNLVIVRSNEAGDTIPVASQTYLQYIEQGLTITPIRKGRLRRLPQVVVVKSDLVQAEIEFVADVESQDHYAVRWTPPHFNGVPYLSLPPDMRSSPIRTFEDFVELKDFGFGDADQTTEAKVTARQWDLPFRLDAAESSELISIFGACRGRFGSLWLPSWTEDWTIRGLGPLGGKMKITSDTSFADRWGMQDETNEEQDKDWEDLTEDEQIRRERMRWLALQIPGELIPVKVDNVGLSHNTSNITIHLFPGNNAYESIRSARPRNFSAFSLNRARFGQDRLRLTFDAQGLCQGSVRFVELPFEYNQPERKRTAIKTVSFRGSGDDNVKKLPDVECESFIARNDSEGSPSASAAIFPQDAQAGEINSGEKSIVLAKGQETRIYAQSPAEFSVRQPTTDADDRNGSLSLIIDTPDQDRPAWLYEFFEEMDADERIADPLRLTSYWRTYNDGTEWKNANIEHGDIEKNTTLDASEIEIMLNQKTNDFANDHRTNILWDIIERELHPVNLRFKLWEMPIRGLPKRLVFDGTVITVGREGSDTLKISARDYFDFSNKRVGRTRLSVRCSAALFDQDCGVGWAKDGTDNWKLDSTILNSPTPENYAPSITSRTAPTLLPKSNNAKAYAWRFKILRYGDGNGNETRRKSGQSQEGKELETVRYTNTANYEVKGIPYVIGKFQDFNDGDYPGWPQIIKPSTSTPEEIIDEADDGSDNEFFVNGSIILQNERRTIFKINKLGESLPSYEFQALINIQFANIDRVLETLNANLELDDYAVITAGCDKSWVTCHSRFQNTPRFRGAPRIPPKNPIITSLSEPAQPNSGKKGASGTC